MVDEENSKPADKASTGGTPATPLFQSRPDAPIDPELRRWLEETRTRQSHGSASSYVLLSQLADVLPFAAVILGILAFALLASWALQNLP